MKTPRYRRDNKLLLGAGVLLALYLALLLALSANGQVQLRESLLTQQQQGLEKQATAVAYFLASQQSALTELATRQSIQNLIAKRRLGIAARDSLSANLEAVTQDIVRTVRHQSALGRPVFRNIALVENDGRILTEVNGPETSPVAADTYRVRLPTAPGEIVVSRSPDGILLRLSAPVHYANEQAGFVTAEIAPGPALKPFLVATDTNQEVRGTALMDMHDQLLAASDSRDWAIARQHSSDGGSPVLRAAVANTDFYLIRLPDLTQQQGVLTSPLFLAALALIAVLLILGLGYMLRLNNHNLLLQMRSYKASQQLAAIRQENEQLQHEIDQRLAAQRQLTQQANFDELTSLPNRNLALDRLTQAIRRAKRENGSVVVFFLDLDRFKQVNDSLGHAAGDELLREAAKRLSSRVRDSDTVSRLGGDEFLVICLEEQLQFNWEQLAEELLRVLAKPFYIANHEFLVGASIGIAGYPEAGSEPQRLLKNADIAMYAAKQAGRNRYRRYNPSMDAAAVESTRLENSLRRALERQELHLAFQPIVELNSGTTIAVEALLRWTNKDLGVVEPERFIPIAEEIGVIHEIGEWSLVEACRTISAMQPDKDFRVAVNLSSKQFSRPGRLLDCTLYALQASGLMPSQLELEITESMLIDDSVETANLIHQLDRIGVRLSIDDFGTGYSALNYLQRFPFDVLKIDRTFTRQLPDNESNASLIQAIMATARALGLEVIAEGVENREQAGFLLVQHCNFGQGFLYSEPMSAEQLALHLTGERAMSA